MEIRHRVAFVTPQMTNPFSRTIWHSLQDSAMGLGVRLTALVGGPLDLAEQPLPGRRLYDVLDKRNFDGLLLFSGALGNPFGSAALDRFVQRLAELPTVSLGVIQEGVTSVGIDQGAAVGQLVRHLYDHGYRRFGFIAGTAGQAEAEIRRQAFQQTLSQLGVRDDQIAEFPGDFSRQSGVEAVRALAHSLNSPMALVCSSDMEAVGVFEECRVQGIEIPGQLAVVGFDDIDLAVYQEPSLTTVRQPFLQQSARALTLLVRMIEGEDLLIQELAPAQVMFRRSCGCRPLPTPDAPSDKSELLQRLLATQTDATQGFKAFTREWISDYLTAFEYLLETGNAAVLSGQWALYYSRHGQKERGLPFRTLTAGLERLYSDHPGFEKAIRENLLLAGAAEAGKGIRNDWATQTLFYELHKVELAIGQINDRKALAEFPFRDLVPLGIAGLALVRHGTPPVLEYFRTSWDEASALVEGTPIEYPDLLPAAMIGAFDREVHRIAVALTAENTYLGYAVFWTGYRGSLVSDSLANWFSAAFHRVELLERLRDQSESLRVSLEEARRMQEQLIETEKVASLGRLVAGVAHEINTPLGTGITGSSFFLDRIKEVGGQFEAGTLSRSTLAQFFSQGKEALDGVLRNLMKAGDLIQAFKGLGLDHGQREWGPVNLGTLMSDLETLYMEEFAKKGVKLSFEVPTAETLVYSQSSALVQVVGELLDNALEHAFVQGTTQSPQVHVQVEVQESRFRLAVTDNGRGLEADERRHLFDPLFTTRRAQGHAGLGLHLAFRLVTATLGGQLTVASEPGSGSCFLCSIPIKPWGS